MSISRASRYGSLLRRRADSGFTLIELMVAIVILGIITAASTPLLVSGLKAAALARDATMAKNLSAARLNQMRSLSFHVDASNGPFLDLLDEYFTNVSTTALCVPPTAGVGTYVTGSGTSGEPTSGPFYKVMFTASPTAPCTSAPTVGNIVMPPRYTQEVDTQFLVPNQPGRYVTPPSNYNNDNPTSNQTDQPPSLVVGVTVITSWTLGKVSHTFRAYTEISDSGLGQSLVSIQAGATAIDVSSALSDDSPIDLVAGQVGGSGTLANESSASSSGAGALLTQTLNGTATTVPSTQAQAVAPPSPAGSSGIQSTNQVVNDGYVSNSSNYCGWGSVGPTQLADLSATVTSGQPAFPSDAGTGANTTSSVAANGTNGCAGVVFTNLYQDTAGGGSLTPAATNQQLGLSAAEPILQVPDAASGTVLSSSVSAFTPAQVFTGTQPAVTSSASVQFDREIDVFPGMSFVTSDEHSHALVYISGLQASISCASNSAGPTSDSYSGTLGYWDANAAGYDTISLSLSNANLQNVLNAALSTVVNTTTAGPVLLSAYIHSWTAGSLVAETPSGSTGSTQPSINAIQPAFQLDTRPVLASSYANSGDSAVEVQLAAVSCASKDSR